MVVFVLIFVALVNVDNLFSAAYQGSDQSIPTLFELCADTIYRAKNDVPYQLEFVAPSVAAEDKKLCNKVLRHILRCDGLSADRQTVEQLIKEGSGLYPVLTLQGLVRDADIDDQNHECPIDVINPGFNMTKANRNFMNMLQCYGFNFNIVSGQKLVSRAIHNNNNDFVQYAIAHGLYIPEYLMHAWQNNDTYAFNRMSNLLCFKGCKDNCYKIHQSDSVAYGNIANIVSPITCSAFFQAYAFRHAIAQQSFLNLMKKIAPLEYDLFAAGMIKQGTIAIYRPHALGDDWIIKTDSNNKVSVRVLEYKVGDETSYTFIWNNHILTLPYSSSGIAASLTQCIDRLGHQERKQPLALHPAKFNAKMYKDMKLEIFYRA